MQSRDGRLTIVYNGEVFNYRELRKELESLGYDFITNSDTEVLLTGWAEWGQTLLPKIVGMFSFAVIDTWRKTLTLVKDAFGIKPLYWSLNSGQFFFSSEIPSLLLMVGQRPRPNAYAVHDYLTTGLYDRYEETFFEGVNRLPPAGCMTLDLNLEEPVPIASIWWRPDVVEKGPNSIEEAASELRELLIESVRLHLRSDVPLGFALSGGIDSTALVSIARYLEPDMPLNTFSFVAPESEFDEEFWVDIANFSVRASDHKLRLDERKLMSDLSEMVRVQGEPFGSTSIYAQYSVFRKAREAGIKVTLDGQGADEMFAGYPGYIGHRLNSLLDKSDYRNAAQLLTTSSQLPGKGFRSAIRAVTASRFTGLERGNPTAKSWLNSLESFGRRQNPEHGVPVEKGRRLVSELRRELTSGGGLSRLLRHGDRNSMRWSIESRVPFLTIPLVEAALGFQEHHLLSASGQTKHVLRTALRGIIPAEIADRKDKVGFRTPEESWLISLGPEIMGGWLDGLGSIPFIDLKKATKGIGRQIKNEAVGPETWRFVNLSKWALEFL